MNPKGTVIIKRDFKHTKLWPDNKMLGYDMEKDYKNALKGKAVPVVDIAVDGSSYLVFGKGEKSGGFIWDIDKGDTVGFLPIIKKNGTLVACHDNPLDSMKDEMLGFVSSPAFKEEVDKMGGKEVVVDVMSKLFDKVLGGK